MYRLGGVVLHSCVSVFIYTKIKHLHVHKLADLKTSALSGMQISGTSVIRTGSQQGFSIVLTFSLVLSLKRREGRTNTPSLASVRD